MLFMFDDTRQCQLVTSLEQSDSENFVVDTSLFLSWNKSVIALVKTNSQGDDLSGKPQNVR